MFCIINSQEDNKWKINEQYVVYDACGVMTKKKTPRTILFGMIVNHQFYNVIIQLVTVCFVLISTVCIVMLMHSTRVALRWNFKNN